MLAGLEASIRWSDQFPTICVSARYPPLPKVRAADPWRKRFGVAVSSVVKWSQRYRTTGSVAPGKMGGHRKPVLDPHRAFIVERITQTPHLTLHGLKAELAARGVKVSHNAVWLFLRREGLRFKKNTVRPRTGTRRRLS